MSFEDIKLAYELLESDFEIVQRGGYAAMKEGGEYLEKVGFEGDVVVFEFHGVSVARKNSDWTSMEAEKLWTKTAEEVRSEYRKIFETPENPTVSGSEAPDPEIDQETERNKESTETDESGKDKTERDGNGGSNGSSGGKG